MKGWPIRGLPVLLSLVLDAESLKAKYPLSYAGCFAVDQAVRSKASILTGDPEFKAVASVVTIENRKWGHPLKGKSRKKAANPTS